VRSIVRTSALALALVACTAPRERAAVSPPATSPPPDATPAPDAGSADLQIAALYDFRPRDLTGAQRETVSKALDALWSEAKQAPDRYVPALRSELADLSNPPFFLYDGAQLLLSLSNEPADRRIAAAALAHCDLADLDRTQFLRAVHSLRVQGEDVTAAALHLLSDPGFKAVIPQHALTLGQGMSLVYLLVPMEPATWVGAASSRLALETNVVNHKSLLLALWYAQTPEADAAIRALQADEGAAMAVRSYAGQLLAGNALLAADVTRDESLPTDAAIRAARTEALSGNISDEGLLEMDRLTTQLILLRQDW
jgi:hypothetical protein